MHRIETQNHEIRSVNTITYYFKWLNVAQWIVSETNNALRLSQNMKSMAVATEKAEATIWEKCYFIQLICKTTTEQHLFHCANFLSIYFSFT